MKSSKEFKRDPFTSPRFCLTMLLAAVLTVALTACGGGGGAPAPGANPPGGSGTDTVVVTPPVTPTYTATAPCASGPALTSTVSQAAANALVPESCPAISTASVGVKITGNVLSITGIPTGVSVASSTVTMVSGASTVVFVNGAITSGTLLSNATYTYAGGQVKFTNAPSITIAGSTVSPVIAAAVTWPANITNLVETGIVNGVVNQNLKVTVWTTMSPYAANIGNNADWNANLINGNVKIVKSGEMAADINGVPRNIWRAIMRSPSGTGGCFTPVNAHDGSSYNGDSHTSVSCVSVSPDYMIGVSDTNTNKNGILIREGALCFLNTVTRGSELVACPF